VCWQNDGIKKLYPILTKILKNIHMVIIYPFFLYLFVTGIPYIFKLICFLNLLLLNINKILSL